MKSRRMSQWLSYLTVHELILVEHLPDLGGGQFVVQQVLNVSPSEHLLV